MKKLFLFSVIVAMMSTVAVAQETKEKTAPPDAKKQTEMMAARAEWDKKIKEELKLTPDQITKYDALNKEYNEKFNVVLKDASLDKDAQKEKVMALKKEKDAKFTEMLTPDQQATYKQMVEKKKKEMASKPGY